MTRTRTRATGGERSRLNSQVECGDFYEVRNASGIAILHDRNGCGRHGHRNQYPTAHCRCCCGFVRRGLRKYQCVLQARLSDHIWCSVPQLLRQSSTDLQAKLPEQGKRISALVRWERERVGSAQIILRPRLLADTASTDDIRGAFVVSMRPRKLGLSRNDDLMVCELASNISA